MTTEKKLTEQLLVPDKVGGNWSLQSRTESSGTDQCFYLSLQRKATSPGLGGIYQASECALEATQSVSTERQVNWA